jgi:peptide deformylase
VIRRILQDGAPELRHVAVPVTTEPPWVVRELASDLVATMRAARGAGIAAPQIGVLLRVVVIVQADGVPLVLVNPCILARSGSKACLEEGCLSVAGRRAIVAARARRVTVAAQTLSGVPIVREFKGPQAVCVQHELDHLDGLLFTDLLGTAS